MKTLIAFIQKEFRHILRDKWTLLIIVGMPIAQLLLFGFAINTEVRDASVAVFDPVCDELTSRIVERIHASDYFNVTERITDIDRINDIFREGYTSLVIVFSDNFSNDILNGEAGIQLIADGTDPNQASMITAYAGNILASCRRKSPEEAGRRRASPLPSECSTIRRGRAPTISCWSHGSDPHADLRHDDGCGHREGEGKRIDGGIAHLAGQPLHDHHRQGYSLSGAVRLRSDPDPRLRRVRDGCADRGKRLLAGFVSVLFLICTLCLGLLISTLVETQMAAMIASGVGLMMPTMLLSGLIFPIESMPRVLQWISTVVPARWYIQSIKMIMIQGTPLGHTLVETGALTLITIILIVLIIKNFKTRLT